MQQPRSEFAIELPPGLRWLDRSSGVLIAPSPLPTALIDGCVTFLAYLLGSWASPYVPAWTLPAQATVPGAVFASVTLVFASALGLYDAENRYHFRRTLGIFSVSMTISATATILGNYFFFYGGHGVGRLAPAFGVISAWLAACCLKALQALIIARNPRRILIVGDPSAFTTEIESLCDGRHPGVPFLTDHVLARRVTDLMRSSRPSAELFTVLQDAGVGHIVMTEQSRADATFVQRAMQLMQHGVFCDSEIQFYGELFERVPVSQMTDFSVLLDTHRQGKSLALGFKRLIDIVLSVVGIAILFPFGVVLALLIRLESRGPILFRQTRVGQFGRSFEMIKFRTMSGTALLAGGFTRTHDDRVTKVGRLVRPLHLDELPQLWNILRGQMSFVGPRPEVIDFAARMRLEIPVYDCRYVVRPGLTGLAQLRAGYAMDTLGDTLKKLEHDFFYIRHAGPAFDLMLIIRTALFLTRGAR